MKSAKEKQFPTHKRVPIHWTLTTYQKQRKPETLEREEQIKPKANRKEDIIKCRAQNNEIEKRKIRGKNQ